MRFIFDDCKGKRGMAEEFDHECDLFDDGIRFWLAARGSLILSTHAYEDNANNRETNVKGEVKLLASTAKILLNCYCRCIYM